MTGERAPLGHSPKRFVPFLPLYEDMSDPAPGPAPGDLDSTIVLNRALTDVNERNIDPGIFDAIRRELDNEI